MKEMKTDRLTEQELAYVYKLGIKYVTYTDADVTAATVTRLVDSKGHSFTLRINYLESDGIEIVSIHRSKYIRINKGVVEDV